MRPARVMIACAAMAAVCFALPAPAATPEQPAQLGSGFSGVWYSVGTPNAYGPKYSGGMATYPQQHTPIAIYSADANKTFFVYGGRKSQGGLQHMISYYDHATGKVARPRVWLDLGTTTDAHFNPTLSIDGEGHLVMFSNVHGNTGQSRIRRSGATVTSANVLDSYVGLLSSTEANDLVQDGKPVYGSGATYTGQPRFSYSNAWYVPQQGFLHMHVRYMNSSGTGEGDNRDIFYTTSADADNWTVRNRLTSIESGTYQMSWRNGQTVGTVFDLHPTSGINGNPAGLDSRTNLYYMQTSDLGQSWKTAGGQTLTVPLLTSSNPALIHDYRAENKLVYMKDLNYDAQGNPVILYLTTPTSNPGPADRMLHTARWTGSQWLIRDVVTTDHNYDHGSFYIEADGTWRIIAPFLTGPQAYGTGGEIGVWTSSDEGLTWTLADQLTAGSLNNQSYVRRPFDAQSSFYALWADGNALTSSPSHLYFATKSGAVYQLPDSAGAFDAQGFADPVPMPSVPEPSSAVVALFGTAGLLSRRVR